MKIIILIVATFVVGAFCEEKCEPGTTFMVECNKCRCNNDGQRSCTRKMCPPNELSEDMQVRSDVQNGDALSSTDEKDEVHVPINGQVCSPNEIKMEECNRCRCANNGIGWFCTRKACPQREKREIQPIVHYAHHQMKRSSSSDTMPRSDVAPGSPDFSCTPNSSFKYQCNNCRCGDDGKTAACSLKYCIPGEW